MADGSSWMVFIVLNKYLLYLAIAASAGSVFMLAQAKANPFQDFSWAYGLWASMAGLVLACVDFFLQVGLFADAGWAGLLDSSFILMIWDSPLGTQLVLRLCGWMVLGSLLVWSFWRRAIFIWQLVCAGGALVLLSFSCPQAGHTAGQPLGVHFIIGLHFLLGLWWVGCLWPLALSCKRLAPADLQQLMENFGTIASYLVPLLLLAGVGLAYLLVGTFQHLITSAHGQSLLVKTALVVGLLGLAAYHKLKLVPQLIELNKAQTLQRSIYWEMSLGLAVLLLTAVFSSVFGPAVLS